jgi:hypothetical protein
VEKKEIEKELAVSKIEKELAVSKIETELAVSNEKLNTKEEKLNTKEAEKSNLLVRISSMEVEALRARGALTTRGILEQALNYAHKEINSSNPNARFNASDTIEKIGVMVEKDQEPTGPDTLKLFRIFKECKILSKSQARSMCQEMSIDVHGFPWKELSVAVVKERLTPEQFCVISKIATDIFRLRITETTPIPDSLCPPSSSPIA